MNYQAISNIVIPELKKSGYRYEEIKSVSTSSIYYKIYSGDESLLFRISDHKTSKDIKTFRIDVGTDKKNSTKLVLFVKNRIADLSYRKVRSYLGMR